MLRRCSGRAFRLLAFSLLLITLVCLFRASGIPVPFTANSLAEGRDVNGLAGRGVPQFQSSTISASADRDYDGLADGIETGGWWNAVGFFTTDSLDPDSDNDGLTDGQEKLYDTNPLNDQSPGIYVEYESLLKTRQYFAKDSHSTQPWGWQQYGNHFISFGAVVIRRGTTFAVGGPAAATAQIVKSRSDLSSLTPVRDACTGRWRISVPPDGTVGKYQIILQEGSWSKSLNLYVIFELPTPTHDLTQAMIDTFLYDDDPEDLRDETGVHLGDYRYTSSNYGWIPTGEWINAGSGYRFNLQPFEPFVFEEHVIEAINGRTSQWDAASDLVAYADKVTRFDNPRVLFSSWSVLHPGSDDSNQCSNIAGLLTAFQRSAGIPARPFFVDWKDGSFDHSAEIWLNGTWYAARSYARSEPVGCGWNCGYGYYLPQDRYSWGRDIYRPWHSGGSGGGSVIMAVDENWTWSGTNWVNGPPGHEYRWPSWDWDAIVRYDWFDTLFVPYWAYWGWAQAPRVTGTPPNDWPAVTTGLAISQPGETGIRRNYSIYLPFVISPDRSPDDGQTGLVVRGVDDYGMDLDGDGYFDQLVVEIEVNAAQPGTYWLRGELGADHYVPSLMGTGGLIAAAVARADLAAGANRVQFVFDGLRISAAKVDGPYVLKYLSITDVQDPGPDDFVINALGQWSSLYTTAAYRAYDFENRGALLSDNITEVGMDADADGLYEGLTLNVGLNIFTPGTYTVQGVLYDSREQFVAQATWTGTGSTASLQFEGLAGTQGPYMLKELHLLKAAGESIDSMFDVYTTQWVTQSEIKTHIMVEGESGEMGAEAILPGPYSDAGVDTDGDGRFDQLVITSTLVIEPGEGGQTYRIEGWLVDKNGSLVSWAVSDPQVLAEGTHSLALAFSGPAINAHNVDGPFSLVALKLLEGTGYQVSNEVDVAYTTSAYSHEQFESLSYLSGEHTILFEDHLENGGDHWAADWPWSLTTSKFYSPIRAWADSPDGNYANNASVSLTTVPVHLGDVTAPTLQFQTCYDLETGHDYGYVEISTNQGVTWTSVATYTGRTVHWSRETLELGVLDGVDTLQVRFRLNTDADVTADGWYLDDIVVYTVQEVLPVAAFNSSSPDFLGEVTTFDNTSSGGNLSFEWNFGDGSPISTETHPTHAYAAAGTFTVVLTAANSVGSDTSSGRVIIEEPPPSPLGLVGYWTLDETDGQRRDSSEYANHLTDNNTVGSGAGKVGLAADFESDNSEYLSIGDAAQNGLDISGSLTLVGWMRPESVERWQILAAKYEFGVNNRAYRFDLRPGNLLGFIASPDGSISNESLLEANPPFTLRAGTWYHAAGVFDAEERTLAIYVDGDLVASRSVAYDRIHISSAPFMLGANVKNGGVVQHFDGQLDDWRVYNRALTESEIEDLMNPSTSTATPTATSTPVPSPTPTPTETPIPTETSTPTATNTPVPSPTPTLTETPIPTETSTPTATSTPVPSPTPTLTETPIPTETSTPTVTSTPVSSPTPTPTETQVPGLLGHWTLDETDGQRRDSSAYANHLTDNNTVGSGAGKVGLAADFESDNSEYLSIGDAAQNGLDISGSLTLVGWMRPESVERWQILAAKYEFGVSNRGYRFDLRPGNLLGFIASPDGGLGSGVYLEANPPFTLRAGTWYHVAGVFDAEQRILAIYVDGDLVASRSVTYDRIHISSAPFMLGANVKNGGVVQHFDGQLDDWRVYNRALTESEIEDLMNPSTSTATPTATSTPVPSPTPTPSEIQVPGLLGHWTLDETDGQRRDSSAYANHLTDNNTVGSGAGQVGLAADFESDNSEYLSIGDAAQNGLDISGSLTLVGWMRPESVERWQILAAKYEFGVSNRGYRFDLRPGNLLGFIASPDGGLGSGVYLEANPPFTLRAGTWYHVAGVFDAEQRILAIYVDGDLVASRSVTYDRIHISSAPFMLGANVKNGGVVQHFDGQLDDWRVYNRALAESEIEDLMSLAP